MTYRLAALLLFLTPFQLAAQERRGLPSLPPEVEDRVEALRTDQAAEHMAGPATIPAGRTISTDLVVEDGNLELAGTVTGDVLVVGGDLILVEGASVGGDVLVVGGQIVGAETASVGGTLLSYGPGGNDDWAMDGDRADAKDRGEPDEDDWDHEDDWDDDDDWDHDDDDDDGWRRHDHGDDGGLDLGLSVAGNYNRVEGLPVMFGPVIETRGPNRLHLSGQAIWRTQPSSSLNEEIGYQIRAQQGLFGDRLRIGGDVRSMVRAIESHGLNSTESSLAAVLFHSDLHDYYEEESWGAHIELHPASFPIEARLGYRQAEHGTLEVSNPWSLFDRGDDWRAQPIIAEGDVSTLTFGLRVDTRDDEDEPVRGFHASLGIEHALDQDLTMPSIDLGGTVGGGREFEDFTSAHIDLRAHIPVNRWSTLNLRGFVAGNIDEAALPPQYQRAVGGIGTLPGFSLFEGACGSRSTMVRLVTPDTAGGPNELSDEGMLPAYGCDRVALGQLEYRGGFEIGDDHDDDDDGDHDHDHWHDWHDIDLSADWAFFVDVARGWAYEDLTFVDRGDTETMADVGFGLLFDEAGVYAAIPITGDDQSLRVVVRLQRRF